MKTKGDGMPNCTYSRIKAEKQTKARDEENSSISEINGSVDTQHMVDSFVQEVIQKAKTEYFRQCEETDVNKPSCKSDKRRKDKENGRLVPDKPSKKSGKDKPKHRHHYKYSDPVDEKEISEYEQQDRDSLLQWNPNFGAVSSDSRKDSTARNGFNNRIVATFRRLLGCCFGKT